MINIKIAANADKPAVWKRLMAEHSIEEARRPGFGAIQFNFVVKSNTVAGNLWKSVGFEVIGEIPDAIRHAREGLTNAYIMYRKLCDRG